MVIAAFVHNTERRVDMDFPRTPYFMASNVILYKKPVPDDMHFFMFLQVCGVSE